MQRMQIVPTNMTVVDYCDAMDRGDIIVNRQYQRSDLVWPDIAKSFLIETLILGFPMPKLSLYQTTDLKSRRTIKEIVDGQQRSNAIRQFYKDELRLSIALETSEIAGKRYSQIPDEYKTQFINCSLSIDLFVGVSQDQVREVFRRMNSYTVPLNPEEQRHASYQGPFKWFVYRLARDYDSAFVTMGVFTEKQIIRMNDAKLITELCHALVNGISTTDKRSLDAIYRAYDKEFREEGNQERRLTGAFDQVLLWSDVHGTRIMRPYMMYSLLLAIAHARHKVDILVTSNAPGSQRILPTEVCSRNLSVLLEAVEQEELSPDNKRFEEFVKASSEKTNTADNRRTRFNWFYRAITSENL